MKVNVRQAVEADAEQVIALMGQFVQYLRNLGDTTESNFSMDAYLRDGFGSDPAFFGLVADSDEEIAGYLLYHFGYDIDLAARVLHVIDLYVVENYRAHGVGKALMMHAKQECHEVGAKEIVLSVYKRNPSASAFYEHLGAKYIDDEDFLHLEIGDRDEQGNPDTQ